MQAIKTVFEAIPETIEIPPEMVHRRGEIIIIVDDDVSTAAIRTFYGSLPDFPERAPQGIP
jgi:hypothetical protein